MWTTAPPTASGQTAGGEGSSRTETAILSCIAARCEEDAPRVLHRRHAPMVGYLVLHLDRGSTGSLSRVRGWQRLLGGVLLVWSLLSAAAARRGANNRAPDPMDTLQSEFLVFLPDLPQR